MPSSGWLRWPVPRACLVIATQRPSVDVITGLDQGQHPQPLGADRGFPGGFAHHPDAGGAEKLLGRGDMLFMPVGVSKPMRIQGCFVSNREVESVVDFLKSGGQGKRLRRRGGGEDQRAGGE